MTIHLPPELESSIRAEVLSGHFASEDDMVAAAVRDYLRGGGFSLMMDSI
jgi:Arc/MetJ-type ribon-helix-helix transcriptional regulator